MNVSRMAWPLMAIALVATGCGGATSSTPVDGGAGADATIGGDTGDSGPSLDAATENGGCVDGGITFTFTADAAPVCAGSAINCNAFSAWLTLTGPAGATVPMGNPTCIDCNTCTGGCPPGPCDPPVPTQSLIGTLGWDGTIYVASTCGAEGEACGATACAAAGHYVATMCAYPAGADAGTGGSACELQAPTPHCVAVPFDWPLPSGATVVGSY